MNADRISQIVGGGLVALFFALIFGALTVFGLISTALGHFFLFLAWAVGSILVATEIIPGKPTRHKLATTVVLGAMLFGFDRGVVYWKKEQDKPASLIAIDQHATPPQMVPTAAEVAKELAKLRAKPLPPPPLGKPELRITGTGTITGTVQADGQTANSPPLLFKVVENPCFNPLKLSEEEAKPSPEQLRRGWTYALKLTIDLPQTATFRFRIRSRAPIQGIDFGHNQNLEIAQRYQGLEVLDVKLKTPVSGGSISMRVFSSEVLRFTCAEGLN